MQQPVRRLPRLEDLKTVKQLCEEHPELFSEGSLRWLLFNAATNGFETCVLRMGRKILIDEIALRQWLVEHRGVQF
ncbi:MAG: DNA-binding protein [Thermoanaerobaculia bacterium]|nr:DNA-binding protein [Thermoanaerobaculia bacterium]